MSVKLNSTQHNTTQLNWSFQTCIEQTLYSTYLNSTQLEFLDMYRTLNSTQLNSIDFRAPSPVLDSRDPVVSNVQMPDISAVNDDVT
jgi:hypothetical protein